ncbi:MAG TPA: ATP-binding protein [Opitutaceae bacterium]|nr:ATP-binding protein [Opitutaceae bacterium]
MDERSQLKLSWMDLLPVGYVAVTRDGEILAANELIGDWVGVPSDELKQTAISDLIESEEPETLASLLRSPMDADSDRVVEVSLRRGRAPFRRLQVAVKHERLPGQTVLHLVLTDVSQRHREAETLREINIEQEAFTHSISHDLRAPLITITNYSEYLANECSPSLDETARDVLTRIQRAAQRMDNVLQNLLVYSRVGRADMPFSAVDIGNVVTEILIQHDGLIQERRAKVEISQPLFAVHASRELVGQVLANLLTNALKYTPKDREPRVVISARPEKQSVIICVQDNGIGIEASDYDRIFQIFERLHGQAAYPGTGIGLAVVRRAVDRMNGRIWVESEIGKGSRFLVELPKADGSSE